MKQKNVIIIGVALISIVMIVTGALIAVLSSENAFETHMEKGYRYLQEGDFNNAILHFRLAIEEEPTNENAYYSLYQAYLYAGQRDLATTALRVGVSTTRSNRLQELLMKLEVGNGAPAEQPDGIASGQTVENKDVVAILNTDLLNLFSSASYGDYCARYRAEAGSLSGGVYTKYLSSIGATLIYSNTSSERVLDESRGVPYNQFFPTEIRLDNVMTLFGGGRQITFDLLKRLSGVTDPEMNGNIITFTYRGCNVTIICTEEGVISAECDNRIVPTREDLEENQEYSLAATVLDATTGRAVYGAKVRIYKGYSTFGEYEEGTTDSAGKLNLGLAASGTYTIVIEKDGYITENFEAFVLSNASETLKTFYISPILSGDAIRFVLSWGASPTDLDSYLIGTASDGTRVNINFTQMSQSNASGECIAMLDVDDTTSFGPETVTLYDTAGTYEFIVDDYTNSGTVSTSGATVKIYVGSSLYATVSITSGVTDMWHVCSIYNGVVSVTNRAN